MQTKGWATSGRWCWRLRCYRSFPRWQEEPPSLWEMPGFPLLPWYQSREDKEGVTPRDQAVEVEIPFLWVKGQQLSVQRQRYVNSRLGSLSSRSNSSRVKTRTVRNMKPLPHPLLAPPAHSLIYTHIIIHATSKQWLPQLPGCLFLFIYGALHILMLFSHSSSAATVLYLGGEKKKQTGCTVQYAVPWEQRTKECSAPSKGAAIRTYNSTMPPSHFNLIQSYALEQGLGEVMWDRGRRARAAPKVTFLACLDSEEFIHHPPSLWSCLVLSCFKAGDRKRRAKVWHWPEENNQTHVLFEAGFELMVRDKLLKKAACCEVTAYSFPPPPHKVRTWGLDFINLFEEIQSAQTKLNI